MIYTCNQTPPSNRLNPSASLIAILAAIMLNLSACTLAPDPQTIQAVTPATSVEQRLEAAYADLEQAGFEGVIAISRAGGEPSYRSFGHMADEDMSGARTQADIGSITKTITAVMVLKLVDQGHVSLNTTISDVWNGVPDDKAGITIHQMLTHSAGFVDAIGDDFEPLEKADFLNRAFASQLLFEPGERYAYTNVGYSILAAIVEERSGKTYEDYLQSDLLGRTGITDIGYQSVLAPARSLRGADGMGIAATSWGGAKPYWNLIGNGGLIMTPEAMMQFRQAFLQGHLVMPEAVALIQTPHVREGDGAPSFYGYGLVVQDHPELGQFYWHNGGNGTFTANWTDYTDKGDVVFAVASSRIFGADEAVMRITEALFDIELDERSSGDRHPEASEQMIANVKSLVATFIAAIHSPLESDWQDFLMARGAPQFINMVPMQVHMSKFDQFHDDLLGFEHEQIALTGPDEITVKMLNAETGEAKTLILRFENTEGGQLAGVQVP